MAEPASSAATSGLRPPGASDMPGTAATGVSALTAATSTVVGSNVTAATLAASSEDRGVPVSFVDLDPKEQLEWLHNQLRVEERIKEGAENLLGMDLTDDLRMKVESELEMARNKINNITQAISIHVARSKRDGQAQAHQHSQAVHGAKFSDVGGERDDFPSAMHEATSCMSTLLHLARRGAHPKSPTTTSPSTSPSSSTLSELAANVTDPELNRVRVETMARLIAILKRHLRVRYELNMSEVLRAVLPALSDRATKQCRATAYQLLRHSLVDIDSVRRLQDAKLDWYIIKSLARDNNYAIEKEQVVKLIRSIVEIGSERRTQRSSMGSGTVPLSEAVMRALVAIAEYPEDPFRLICLQTLTEILLIDVELMARTDGLRVLLHSLSDGPPELAPLLASAFLHIIDLPRTRAYLRPGTDIEMVLSGVTDAYGKGPDYSDRMKSCTQVISSMLRTWSGLIYFCLDDKLALRAIVDSLRIPSLETREIILDMFFDLFNIKPPEWHQAFIDGRRLTMYRKTRPVPEVPEPPTPQKPHVVTKLTNQYIALMILIFCQAGLLDALASMFEESAAGSNLSRKATLLMAEILQTANRVLPLNIAADIQALPRVFSLASDYDLNEHRIIGTSALTAIDSYNRHRQRLQPTTVKGDPRPRSNSVEDAVRRGQRQAEQAKIKLAMQMDDKTFQVALLETQVMLTRDQTKWKFDVLQELIEGPLLNPKRMEEAIKVTRYIRKLMSFFHPTAHRFSILSRTKVNQPWVRLGCQLLSALLSSVDGQKFLAEDEFLKEVCEGFEQLSPLNSNPVSDPIFSKKRMQETLTYGYFEMLGTLSKRKEGLELLEKFKIWTSFYRLSELRSREDLIKAMIENLDYSMDGHSRIVLSKALTSSYKHIRLYATKHLGSLLRDSTVANAWTLRLLLTQLYDPAADIRGVAVKFLEEACEKPEVLQTVVEMQPTLDHLGEVGHPLLLKFMSTPTGFRFLYNAEYIEREMDLWFHERNLHYVVLVEVFLSKVFNSSSSEDALDIQMLEGQLSTHFYGVLARTELGCQVLQAKGHFAEFAHFIRQHGLDGEDQDLILRLKSILWAVGNIGRTEGGLPFLEEEEIIPAILEIAEQSLVPSVRGTCFFVLGLIASTPQGAEILDDYHWEATLSPLGFPTGMCLPTDMNSFLQLPVWECKTDVKDEKQLPPPDRLLPPKTEEETEVLTAIYNLANTVIANAASRSLARMKSRQEYRHAFTSPAMFYRALHTISSQRYRLPVRRYIIDLFDIPLDVEIIRALSDSAVSLRLQASADAHKPQSPSHNKTIYDKHRRRRVSFIDEEMSGVEEARQEVAEKQPTMSLRPMSRITGFTDN